MKMYLLQVVVFAVSFMLVAVSANHNQRYRGLRNMVFAIPDDLQPQTAEYNQQDGPIGEKVDKFASASGDLESSSRQQQIFIPLAGNEFWLKQSANKQDGESAVLEAPSDRLLDTRVTRSRPGRELTGYQYLTQPYDGLMEPRNYHSLISDFKHYSRIANPSRESRAFKPKLMSTARGFGKRNINNNNQHDDGLTYSDIVSAMVGQRQTPTNENGKMLGRALR